MFGFTTGLSNISNTGTCNPGNTGKEQFEIEIKLGKV